MIILSYDKKESAIAKEKLLKIKENNGFFRMNHHERIKNGLANQVI